MDFARRWSSLGERLGHPLDDRTLADLLFRYQEKHRSYHGLPHLEWCLTGLDEVADNLARPEEAELALWYHDAVYDPRAHDNEIRSVMLLRALSEQGLDHARLARVETLILGTRHLRPVRGEDGPWVADIDLRILGAPDETYRAYARGVRDEYQWVPPDVFAKSRRRVLGRFLERESIFQTEYFRRALEVCARANLTSEIETLDLLD